MSKVNTPPYSTFPTVSNKKILLRQIQDSDINELIEISYYDSIQATTLEQAVEMNSKINADYDKGDSIHWGIIDNQSNKIVGTCGFYRGFDKDEGELGCVLLPKYQGQGYMTSAMLLAVDFGLNKIGLRRIIAITSKQNDKAIGLLARVGFIQTRFLIDTDIEFEFPSKTVK